MKQIRYPKWTSAVVLLIAAAFCHRANAVSMVSNLGDQWTTGGIGDIHALFPGGTPNGNFTASFTTGAGTYALNTITVEFEFDSSYPAGLSSPQALNFQLLQGSTVLGTLAAPVAESTPTQWPQSSNPRAYTTFYDYTPTAKITLNPNTDYSVVISMPAGSGVDAALMFTRSSAYTSVNGWAMGLTSAPDNLGAMGEFLKLGVSATRVPDAANTAVLLSAGLGIMIWGRRKFGR